MKCLLPEARTTTAHIPADAVPPSTARFRLPHIRMRLPADRMAGSQDDQNSRQSPVNVGLVPDTEYGKRVDEAATPLWAII